MSSTATELYGAFTSMEGIHFPVLVPIFLILRQCSMTETGTECLRHTSVCGMSRRLLTMTDEQYSNGADHVEWYTVCHKDGCRGIFGGPYGIRRYAVNDKSAHEKWHEQRDEIVDVEVVKRLVPLGKNHE